MTRPTVRHLPPLLELVASLLDIKGMTKVPEICQTLNDPNINRVMVQLKYAEQHHCVSKVTTDGVTFYRLSPLGRLVANHIIMYPYLAGVSTLDEIRQYVNGALSTSMTTRDMLWVSLVYNALHSSQDATTPHAIARNTGLSADRTLRILNLIAARAHLREFAHQGAYALTGAGIREAESLEHMKWPTVVEPEVGQATGLIVPGLTMKTLIAMRRTVSSRVNAQLIAEEIGTGDTAAVAACLRSLYKDYGLIRVIHNEQREWLVLSDWGSVIAYLVDVKPDGWETEILTKLGMWLPVHQRRRKALAMSETKGVIA